MYSVDPILQHVILDFEMEFKKLTLTYETLKSVEFKDWNTINKKISVKVIHESRSLILDFNKTEMEMFSRYSQIEKHHFIQKAVDQILSAAP